MCQPIDPKLHESCPTLYTAVALTHLRAHQLSRTKVICAPASHAVHNILRSAACSRPRDTVHSMRRVECGGSAAS